MLTGELTAVCSYLIGMDCRRSQAIKDLRADCEKKDEKINSLERKIKELESMKLNLVDICGDENNEGKFKQLDDDCGRHAFRLKELETGSGKNDVRVKDLEKEVAKKEERLLKLEDTIKKGVDKEIAIVKEKVEKLASVEETVNKALLEQKMESQTRNFHLEMSMVSNNLIFRNFPLPDNGIEDKAKLKMGVQDLFQAMGIGPRINVKEAIRFKKKEDDGRRPSWAEMVDRNQKPGLVLVKLGNVEMKKIIFSNIRKLKGTLFQKVSINNQVPKCVLPLVTELEIKARKIRVDSGFKTKTKIELNSGKPKIMIKGENDRDFKDI